MSALISSHPLCVSFLSFLLFWVYRSQVFNGDGDQISRMIESGLWMVQTELGSQAIFQLAYRVLSPFGWDGLAVINLVSCLSGAICVYILILFSRTFFPFSPAWILGLFFSSGLILFAFGHTEYYTMFLAGLFYYGYTGIGYLRGTHSMLQTALAYSIALWMHLGILFALPSLMVLPLLKKKYSDYKYLLIGLSPAYIAYCIKEFHPLIGMLLKAVIPGSNFTVLGLSPSENFVALSPENIGTGYYSMFQWGHLADFLWAWSMRSWFFWQLIIWAAAAQGFRSLLLPERQFLLLYTLCFTFFAATWHPNLGIHQDWDLFAIEAAPCLLLLMTYLDFFQTHHFRRTVLILLILSSSLIHFQQILQEAQFDRRQYGTVKIQLSEPIDHKVTMNGHAKDLEINGIREGIYAGKVIDRTYRQSHNFYVHVAPGRQTTVPLIIGSAPESNLME
ncbi:MAG: hypothetical protein ACOX5R_21615 [bacterium]